MMTFLAAVPTAASANWIIPNRGLCPMGYTSKGEFCIPGPNAKEAFPVEGSCEEDYEQSGSYCIYTR